MAHEVEAHAAHAGTMHRFHLGRRCAGRQQGHATSALRIPRDGIEHRAVVVAVNGGLHDHDAFDTEQAVQRFQPLHRGIFRRVGPLGRVREPMCGTVDVDVGSHADGSRTSAPSGCPAEEVRFMRALGSLLTKAEALIPA
jgi:hypothetical protein